MRNSTISVGVAFVLAGVASSAMLMSASASSGALPSLGGAAPADNCLTTAASVGDWSTALVVDEILVNGATVTGLAGCEGASVTLTFRGANGKATLSTTQVVGQSGEVAFAFDALPMSAAQTTSLTVN